MSAGAFWFAGFLFTIGFVDLSPVGERSNVDKALSGVAIAVSAFVAWPIILGFELRKALK